MAVSHQHRGRGRGGALRPCSGCGTPSAATELVEAHYDYPDFPGALISTNDTVAWLCAAWGRPNPAPVVDE